MVNKGTNAMTPHSIALRQQTSAERTKRIKEEGGRHLQVLLQKQYVDKMEQIKKTLLEAGRDVKTDTDLLKYLIEDAHTRLVVQQ